MRFYRGVVIASWKIRSLSCFNSHAESSKSHVYACRRCLNHMFMRVDHQRGRHLSYPSYLPGTGWTAIKAAVGRDWSLSIAFWLGWPLRSPEICWWLGCIISLRRGGRKWGMWAWPLRKDDTQIEDEMHWARSALVTGRPSIAVLMGMAIS